MFHPVFLKFFFEPGRSAPIGILPAVVRQHLFGYPIFRDAGSVTLDHIFGGLTPEQPKARYIPGIIIQISDEIGVFPGKPERHDIALP